MTRASLLPLFFLAACAVQDPPVTTTGAQRVNTVMVTTNDGAHVANVTSRVQASDNLVTLSLANAWAALPGAYAAVGLTGGAIVNEAEHMFGMGPVVLPRRLGNTPLSRFVDCGSTQFIPNADSYAVRLQVNTQLMSEGTAATRVLTVVEGTARSREMSGNPVTCTTTGELERRIARQLQGTT
ncbi:MAG TPA: hypothetical protein VEY93_16555 [Longimicrobium sp.]|nr:hypothetical protein [Longimicrobium sp.]